MMMVIVRCGTKRLLCHTADAAHCITASVKSLIIVCVTRRLTVNWFMWLYGFLYCPSAARRRYIRIRRKHYIQGRPGSAQIHFGRGVKPRWTEGAVGCWNCCRCPCVDLRSGVRRRCPAVCTHRVNRWVNGDETSCCRVSADDGGDDIVIGSASLSNFVVCHVSNRTLHDSVIVYLLRIGFYVNI